MGAVQHESTATHADGGGRAGTGGDGDLRGWTQVDVLPPDGMQEVSGSSPLTVAPPGQRNSWNESNSEYSRKVQQRRPVGPPYVCSGRATCPAWACWQDTGFQALNRRWSACHLGKFRRIGPVAFVGWPPPGPPRGPLLPAAVAAFACGLAALSVPAARSTPQEPRPLARAARSLRAGAACGRGRGAWCRWCQPALRVLVCCAAQAQSGTVRSSLRPCRRAGAPLEEPGAARRTGTWPNTGRKVAYPGH